jgi:hypothetical protein
MIDVTQHWKLLVSTSVGKADVILVRGMHHEMRRRLSSRPNHLSRIQAHSDLVLVSRKI